MESTNGRLRPVERTTANYQPDPQFSAAIREWFDKAEAFDFGPLEFSLGQEEAEKITAVPAVEKAKETVSGDAQQSGDHAAGQRLRERLAAAGARPRRRYQDPDGTLSDANREKLAAHLEGRYVKRRK